MLLNLNASWEQVQVKLLEKELRSDLKMGVQLYSSLLLWKDDTEGKLFQMFKFFFSNCLFPMPDSDSDLDKCL